MDFLFRLSVKLWLGTCLFDLGGTFWRTCEIIEEEGVAIEDELKYYLNKFN
jgi:hypothetical protein